MNTNISANDTLTALQSFAEQSANAASPQDVCQLAEAVTKMTIGHGLFTVMAFDAAKMEVQRFYTSDPENYPVGGRKKKRDTDWGQHVLTQGLPIIGKNNDDIRSFFDDHEVIIGLGLCSVMNIPIKRLGVVIGTMNLLDNSPHYTEEDIQRGTLITLALSTVL